MNHIKNSLSLPKEGWQGFKENISQDTTSGFVVFLLALPLSLGIASASEFPPIMGIVTAVIGGLVASFFTGSKLTIKGPAAGLIVIVAGAVTEFGGGPEGWRLTLGVMVIAGLLQIVFGLLKWGKYVDIFPLSAVHGMLAAIGLIIIAKQIPVLLNVSPALTKGKGPLELFASIPEFISNLDPVVSVIGGISLAIMLIWPFIQNKYIKIIPAPLVVLLVAIPAGIYYNLSDTAPAYTLVKVGKIIDQVGINVSFGGISHAGVFIKYLFMVALVGSLESLLTVKAIDMIDPWKRKSDTNKDMIAIGIANSIGAVVGGLPMISEVARSAANVANGARTQWANFFHGLFLLISVLLAYQVLELIPNAALAAMLITVGIKLAHPKEFWHTYKIGSEQLAIFVTTIFFTLFEDLLVGIAAGMILKALLHIFRGASPRSLFYSGVEWKQDGDDIKVKLGEVAVFTNYLRTKAVLEGLPSGKNVTIEVSDTMLVDHSVMENLHHFEHDYKMLGGNVQFIGLHELEALSDHPLSARRKSKYKLKKVLPEIEAVPFDESKVLHDLAHYLPSQLALKDFVHHNSLHSFQDMDFFEGIFSANKIFGINVTFNLNEYRKLYDQGRIRTEILDRVIESRKGKLEASSFKQKMLFGKYDHKLNPRVGQLRANWKTCYEVDLDNQVHPLLFRILASYLDQGIALWHFPFEKKGLIAAIRKMEKSSFVSFFRSKRVQELLFAENLQIEHLLRIVVGHSAYYESYLFDQQFAHKGWSGIAAAIEGTPNTLLYEKKIHLKDVILLELLLEIDALDMVLGKNWKPLAINLTEAPQHYFSKVDFDELDEILQIWQEAFEWDYYDEVLGAVGQLATSPRVTDKDKKSFQAIFCIDDRECSIRRHVELQDPNCETLGAPGFFGVAIYFQPFGGKFYEKNCPAPVTPRHLIKEIEVSNDRNHELFHSKHTHTFFRGFMYSLSLGLFAGLRMIIDLFRPKMRPDIADAFSHMDINGTLQIDCMDTETKENGLQVGYTFEEMADVVESLLKSIGMTSDFAPLIYVIAHGSSSANNPHHGAHDCGACSGRPGAVNARVFSYMANHPNVRLILESRGLHLPESTQFVGAMHDTASDEIRYYDTESIDESNAKAHHHALKVFEDALDHNAKERARRFASIDINQDIKKIRKDIKERSVSYFEPRPELGHGTNALCHVGSRHKMKGLFLDRRAFLQSYDYRNDPDGVQLAKVMAPLPVVCGGINLEYYFSRMDNEKMGAGTKLPHNVMGLIGVANSSDGDLRPGLPLQMIENHDPVRLLMMIEHRPEVIFKVISSSQSMYDWFDKGWIHLAAISPDDGIIYYFENGVFKPYKALSKVKRTANIHDVIVSTKEMTTNHILDATKENIPVHIYDDKN